MNKQEQKEAMRNQEPVVEGPLPFRRMPLNKMAPGGNGKRISIEFVECLSALAQAGVEHDAFVYWLGDRMVAFVTWGDMLGDTPDAVLARFEAEVAQ